MKYKASANISHLILSVNSHVLGAGLSVLSNSFINSIFSNPYGPNYDVNKGILYFIALQAVFAFLLSCLFKLPWSWRIINLILLPSIFLYSHFGLPSWFLLLAFIFCSLVFLPALWTRIPYYPTSYETYGKVSELLPMNKQLKFIDIGCGFSSLLIYLAKRHPEIQFYGNEIGPLPYLLSKFRSLFRRNVHISFKSFWAIGFSEYDYVYAFLAPPPMERLWNKVKAEMKTGGVFISNTFEVPAKPDKVIELSDYRQNKIMIFDL